MREGGVSIDGGEIETFDLHGRILPSSLDHAFTYRAGQRLLDDLSLEPLLWWVPYESRPHDVWILRTSEEDGSGGGVSLLHAPRAPRGRGDHDRRMRKRKRRGKRAVTEGRRRGGRVPLVVATRLTSIVIVTLFILS